MHHALTSIQSSGNTELLSGICHLLRAFVVVVVTYLVDVLVGGRQGVLRRQRSGLATLPSVGAVP